MQVLVPITSARDIDILNPSIYGTEFFCGYLPHWWIDSYNNPENPQASLATPLNNRNGLGANITSRDDFVDAIKKAEKYNTKLYLVLNAKYYPDYVYDDLEKYINEVVALGITRMIVCDIGLMEFLEENYPNIKVSVSCLNQATNSMAIGFYNTFANIERIVFPRHMSSDEISQIVTRYPELEFEYFIFSNKCLYDDGYCRGIHEFTPICKDQYIHHFSSLTGKRLDCLQTEQLQSALQQYSEWTKNYPDANEKNYCTPNFACSACSLLKLKKYNNIVSVKLSIRGHDIDERLRQLEMARNAISIAESGCNEDEIRRVISKLYGKEDLCHAGTSCMMI